MTDSPRIAALVFAKPPLVGQVKTRLIDAIGAEGAADLARALLQDTWAALASSRAFRPVLVTPDPRVDHGVSGERWVQGGGPLGDRLEAALSRALGQHRAAVVLGADTAGLGPEHLRSLEEALARGPAALGRADDGGFWALGLRSCPAGLLRDLPWSTPGTADATIERLTSLGLPPLVASPAFDVDRPADLDRFRAEIPRARAPFTHLALDRLGWPSGRRAG